MQTFREFYKEKNGHEYMDSNDQFDLITVMFLRVMQSMADYRDYLAKAKG